MKITATIAGILALFAVAAASAQQFPTVPDHTVIGRIGVGGSSGPSQAIPFATLSATLFGAQSANTVNAGPASGGSAIATYRLLVGADLPSIFTKDTLFKSGRPWADVTAYGAVADNVTNNATAFTNAIAAVAALGGGVVFVPPASNLYCISSAVTVSQNVWIIGPASSSAAQISACGTDTTVFNLTGSRSGLSHLNILGKGLSVPGDVVFGASQVAIKVSSGAVQASLINLNVQGGSIGIRVDEVDVFAQDIHAASFYGNAMLYVTKGGWYNRLQLDGSWPNGLPAAGHAPIVAWTNAHAYTAGDVVSLVCPGGLGLNMYIQAMTTGTSGGSAPTCKNYGVTFTDNTTSWQVATPVGGSNIQIDGTSVPAEVQISQLDMGSAENGLSITNANMSHIRLSQCIISGTVKNGVNAANGNDLAINSCEITGGFINTGVGINFASTWTGEGRITNSLIWSGQYGVFIGGGTNTVVNGNGIYGQTTAAVGIAANVTNFNVNGNTFGPSGTYGTNGAGVIVAAGTSNNYNISGNTGSGAGAAITDAGTGTNKSVNYLSTALVTLQVFTSGTNATYTKPAGVTWIEVELAGGGGGGAGSGTTPGAAGVGGNTCWNTSSPACTTPLYQATGGTLGATNGATAAGGGVAGSLTCNDSQSGNAGQAATAVANTLGGYGGGSRIGGGSPGGSSGAAAAALVAANTGAGGGGAGDAATANTGGGGGGAGWCYFATPWPAASYFYTVGAAGTAGTAGTSGFAGTAGSAGKVRVIEHYN